MCVFSVTGLGSTEKKNTDARSASEKYYFRPLTKLLAISNVQSKIQLQGGLLRL